MKTLRIENKKSALEIQLDGGLITSLQGNGKDLCEGNTYPLFVVSIYEENYQNKHISSSEFTFEKMEKVGGRYESSCFYARL